MIINTSTYLFSDRRRFPDFNWAMGNCVCEKIYQIYSPKRQFVFGRIKSKNPFNIPLALTVVYSSCNNFIHVYMNVYTCTL